MTNRKASTAGPLSSSQKNLTTQSSSSPSNASNSPGPENFILEIHEIPKILSRSDYSDIEDQPMLRGFRQPDSTPEFPATTDDLVNKIKNHLSQGQLSINPSHLVQREMLRTKSLILTIIKTETSATKGMGGPSHFTELTETNSDAWVSR
jgi:hypothetical protein